MKIDYILADVPSRNGGRAAMRRSVLLALLCGVSLTALMSRESEASRSRLQIVAADETEAFSAPLPELEAGSVEAEVAAEPVDEWKNVVVQRGQTFSSLIESQGMPKDDWVDVLALGTDVAPLKQIKSGAVVQLRKDAENRLEELIYEVDETRTLQVRRVDDKLESLIITAELEHRTVEAHGIIRDSLFLDGQKAGLSNRLIFEMAEIFGYDIDFARDLHEGDRFSVIYSQIYKNGEKLRNGRIMAAEFVNQGKTHRAMRHISADGHAAYYALDGSSLKKAFMRTPVDFARISSGFNLRRRHPILNVIRAHKGVDYAAGTGTPIKASGDGIVEFVGNKSGYGRTVILKHGRQTTTLYAHMSRFKPGLRNGSRVSRGQVIGYVGSSGLATAPHLHYEFRVNGVHKNPATVTFPRSNGLSKAQVAEWKNRNAELLARLDTLSSSQLARAGGASQAKLKR